jgi:alginate O-acetyltransferase complex protein AlgI
MVFSSLLFLFGFLPIFLVAYYLTPVRYRNYTALLASIFFYSWGEPIFAVILVSTSLFDYILSRYIAARVGSIRTRLLVVGVGINILLLLYFKYANFFVHEITTLLGLSANHWTMVVLPIGISFWVFQKISYLVDVYRKETEPADHWTTYILYVALFPQLIAGPIVRYHDIAAQFKHRVYTKSAFVDGVWRFCRGLAKKVLIADQVAHIADSAFAMDPSTLSSPVAWVGILAYAMQLYFDFSGYSDMAIGLARMMGFNLLENFRYPYIARSFTDFWRRWHISLSRFMREYVYIPLGGNRHGRMRVYANLWFVFLLSGLWHGASWTFVLWGAYHGFFLMLDKLFYARIERRLPNILTITITFVLVLFGWVLFRSPDIHYAVQYLQALMTGMGDFFWPLLGSNRAYAMLVLALVLSFVPAVLPKRVFSWYHENMYLAKVQTMQYVLSICLLFLSAIALANSSYQPFIYFQF